MKIKFKFSGNAKLLYTDGFAFGLARFIGKMLQYRFVVFTYQGQ